ncbi:MAG: glucose/arabinose dehydrogenase [Halioglobus sp.]|jgi:glucose/arabinose dehydrogenase
MKLRPFITCSIFLVLVAVAWFKVDWSYSALKLYMATSQPLGVGEPPHQESNGEVTFKATAITDQLSMPWSFAFMPGGDILISERPGTVQRLEPVSGTLTPVTGVPEVYHKGQGGLLDIALHPDFPAQNWVYLTYSLPLAEKESTTRLVRARLLDNALHELEVLYTAKPAQSTRKHFGSRLLFDGPYLYMTMGERGHREYAQKLDNDLGKVLRFTRSGGIPTDNPFVEIADARPAIYSYGHRNPQGLARHPDGSLWVTEHGPQGGDELNQLKPGANYGWPVITYGEEYGGGEIGEGTAKAGLEQPVHYYVPSIATGGLAFYDGAAFPAWQGNALIAALRAFHLNRVEIGSNGDTSEFRLLSDLSLRVRDVKVGPQGHIYVLSEQGSLIKLQPVGG